MRRANGTGSIVKLKGSRRRPYCVRVSGRDKYGGIIQRAIGYYATAKEAQDALDEYNRQKAAGISPPVNQLQITVGEVYSLWSARAYKSAGPSSVRSYSAAWRQRISIFADRKIREVTLDDWQSIVDRDEAEGLSQSSINNDVILIRALCAWASKRDILSKDYSTYLEIPSVGQKLDKGVFSDIQIEKLHQLAQEGYPWADTALILCYTGFRISELLTLTRFSHHTENGGYLVGGVKTDAGKDRIVPIHQKIKPYIEKRLAEGNDYLISREGRPVSAAWYRDKAFRPIADLLGTPKATPHWCRHTFATRLHAAGVDELTVKWLLGHSTDSDITHHYTHQTIGVLVDGIQRLA